LRLSVEAPSDSIVPHSSSRDYPRSGGFSKLFKINLKITLEKFFSKSFISCLSKTFYNPSHKKKKLTLKIKADFSPKFLALTLKAIIIVQEIFC
jgi:hypothetical protein